MERNIEGAASAIVDSAVAVHRELGAGLLESTYQACLVHELRHRGFKVATEVTLPVQYKTYRVDAGYRVDMVVDDAIIVENKSVSTVLPIHTAQLVTYLRLSGRTLGFLINWNVRLIRDGLHRVVSGHPR